MKLSQYQEFIHQSRYARWDESLGRRETWNETVDRYCDFLNVPADTREAIRRMDVMPSMRALWSAGPALSRNHAAAYNCAFTAVDSLRSFDETIFTSMSGCGVGYSVERQFVRQLPRVPILSPIKHIIQVEDSREGWAHAFREFVEMLYSGIVPSWDLSHLRPAGARLRTTGGQSSGPGPLDELFKFTLKTITASQTRQLEPIEVHDIMCKIGDIVVAGGVRRSALISLSDVDDEEMRLAKHGAWWDKHGHRCRANNSAVFGYHTTFEEFSDEWHALYKSKSGERGMFNRYAARVKALYLPNRDAEQIVGTNPCAEISLRSNQFCNLSEVVIRPEDTFEDLKRKVEHATIIGTLQSTLTDFPYLRPVWKKNCEEERLLGVSLTGIMDHAPISEHELEDLKRHARAVNLEWAHKLGINPSAAITTVKPSGTVSQLVNSSSGIHPRFFKYYIRRGRQGAHDPLTKLLIEAGVPHEIDARGSGEVIFEFPERAPEGSKLSSDVGAIEQCEAWLTYNRGWAEHSVSCTIYYRDDEFFELGQWVWDHFDQITGLSFLPRSDHTYVQAPYEEIDEQEYRRRIQAMPDIDWSKLSEYEHEDNTVGAQTLACSGDKCELA